MHDYDEGSGTCYAIGDAFAVSMGTAATNRQPASGVFEEVSSIVKPATNDWVTMWDGTNEVNILSAAATTQNVQGSAASIRTSTYNMAVKIGNTIYLRKASTNDRIIASGVQVDA
jgi:hypothetical protein